MAAEDDIHEIQVQITETNRQFWMILQLMT